MVVLIFRIGVSLIFLMTAVPKVLLWGRVPSRPLKDKIVWHKAGFIDMEVTAAYHTWQAAFGYPTLLFRPLGIVLIISVIALNVYPPPSAIGYHVCFFLVMVLGGGLWTWLFNYKSPRNCVPMFVTLLALTILTSVKEDISGAEIVNPTAWIRTLVGTTSPPSLPPSPIL